MDDAGEIEPLDLLLRQVQFARDCDSEPGDALLMAGGVGIAHLHRAGDRADGRFEAHAPALLQCLVCDVLAQRSDAEGEIVGEFLQELQFIGIEGIGFRRVDRQHGKDAGGTLQRQARQRT